MPQKLQMEKSQLAAISETIVREKAQTERVTVFTDSPSTVHTIESGHSTSRPNLLRQIYETKHDLNRKVTLIWVPSHIGMKGNEKADKFANEGTAKEKVDIDVGQLELQEAYTVPDEYCADKWQQQWTSDDKPSHYKAIEPSVKTVKRSQYQNRRLEVITNRLQFGCRGLNAYLHRIKRHPAGLCDKCGELETVGHYIIKCFHSITKYRETSVLSVPCKTLNLQ